MNDESEDRPISSSRPAPYGDPPERPDGSRPAGGPPAEPGVEPVESLGDPLPPPPAVEPDHSAAEPEARWEDVVDPQPAPLPPEPAPVEDWPEPSRVRRAPAAATAVTATAVSAGRARRPPEFDEDEADDDAYDEYDDEQASRWVSLLATIGTALIGIVTVQVLTSVVEGMTLKTGQRVGIPDDLFHRLGYPFGGLGATALVFLVLGVVLVSMPSVLDELLSESQDRVVGVALVVSMVMGVVIAIGSLLAVRANLHEYAAKNVAVPSYVRVQFTNFLLGGLGAAALALFGAIAAMNERKRERY